MTLDIFDEPGVADLPLIVRRAMAFRKVLLEMPITIEEDDLIVGNTVQDGAIVRTFLPKYGTNDEYVRAENEGSSLASRLSHKTPYYYDVLGKGLSGIITDLDDKSEEIAARPPSAERDEKLAFFQAMKLEAQAVIALAHRYADLAASLANDAESAQRRQELQKIAQVCRRVPEFPATTFQEAAQCFWLVHYALFSTNTHLSCGRFDQFLYPMLRTELDAGAITLEEAQEIIDCVWLRFNDRGQIIRENFYEEEAEEQGGPASNGQTPAKKVRIVAREEPHAWTAGHRKRFAYTTDAADAINHFGQNILLSGIRPDGSDGTNELTYISLNSLEKFAFTSPVVTVRLHKESPPELVDENG